MAAWRSKQCLTNESWILGIQKAWGPDWAMFPRLVLDTETTFKKNTHCVCRWVTAERKLLPISHVGTARCEVNSKGSRPAISPAIIKNLINWETGGNPAVTQLDPRGKVLGSCPKIPLNTLGTHMCPRSMPAETWGESQHEFPVGVLVSVSFMEEINF